MAARGLHGADGGQPRAGVDLPRAEGVVVVGDGGGAGVGDGRVGGVEGVGDGGARLVAWADATAATTTAVTAGRGGVGGLPAELPPAVATHAAVGVCIRGLLEDEVCAELVGLEDGVGDDVVEAVGALGLVTAVAVLLRQCRGGLLCATTDEDEEAYGDDEKHAAAAYDTADDGACVGARVFLLFCRVGAVRGGGLGCARLCWGSRSRLCSIGGWLLRGARGCPCRRGGLLALGRLRLIFILLTPTVADAGVPKGAAGATPTRLELHVKHGRLDGRLGLLLGIQRVEVAGDALDPIARRPFRAAQDGRVAGEGETPRSLGAAEVSREVAPAGLEAVGLAGVLARKEAGGGDGRGGR